MNRSFGSWPQDMLLPCLRGRRWEGAYIVPPCLPMASKLLGNIAASGGAILVGLPFPSWSEMQKGNMCALRLL